MVVQHAVPSPSLEATTSVTPRSPRMEATGQRLYKALLGVADTNLLLRLYTIESCLAMLTIDPGQKVVQGSGSGSVLP